METVADKVLAALARGKADLPGATPGERRAIHNALNTAVRGSTRFFLDEEASSFVSQLGALHPELLYAQLSRARSPFDRVFIDYSVPAFVTAATGPDGLRPGAPDRSGVVIERLTPTRFRMTPITVWEDRANLLAVGILYDIQEPLPPSPDAEFIEKAVLFQLRKVGVSIRADKLLGRRIEVGDERVNADLDLGSEYVDEKMVKQVLESGPLGTIERNIENAEATDFRRKQVEKLQAHARYDLTPATSLYWRRFCERDHERGFGVIAEAVLEFCGVWKLVLSAMSMLNEHDLYVSGQYRHGNKSRIIAGKVVPFVEYRTISLKLPRPWALNHAIKLIGESIPRRRHEVMGHWAHRRGKGQEEGCTHVFVNMTENRQVCALCEYDRWWINEHERGDASIGVIVKNYDVEVR